jgi:trimethylamine-N-oxide reductase cytochrome c-type subunit TorC
MSASAAQQMKLAAEKDQSCIDCHKGIAHKLPEGYSGAGDMMGTLENHTKNTDYSVGQTLVTFRHTKLFEDAAMTVEAGEAKPASSMKVIASEGDAVQVELNGWRKARGFARVIQEEFGMNIGVAALTKKAAKNKKIIKKFEKKVDDLTGLPWQRVTATLWIKKEALLNSVDPIWEESKVAYQSNCSTCHTQPEEAHFDANTWPGMFNGMLAFVNFDADTEALILKYLQKHSSDFTENSH